MLSQSVLQQNCFKGNFDNLNKQNPHENIFSRRMDYWHTLKAVFTNRAFVVSVQRRFVKTTNCQLQNQCLRLLICISKVIFLFLGGSMAFISCLATKMEQIMCRQVPSIFLPTSVPDCMDFQFFLFYINFTAWATATSSLV